MRWEDAIFTGFSCPIRYIFDCGRYASYGCRCAWWVLQVPAVCFRLFWAWNCVWRDLHSLTVFWGVKFSAIFLHFCWRPPSVSCCRICCDMGVCLLLFRTSSPLALSFAGEKTNFLLIVLRIWPYATVFLRSWWVSFAPSAPSWSWTFSSVPPWLTCCSALLSPGRVVSYWIGPFSSIRCVSFASSLSKCPLFHSVALRDVLLVLSSIYFAVILGLCVPLLLWIRSFFVLLFGDWFRIDAWAALLSFF